MRLYPGSPDAKMRIIDSALEVEGYYLPPGTEVGIPIWSTHRDPLIWGPDSDGGSFGFRLSYGGLITEFRPSRWLNGLTAEQMVGETRESRLAAR